MADSNRPPAKPRRTIWGRLTIVLALAVIACNLWLITKVMEVERQATRQHAFYQLCQGVAPANQRTEWFCTLAADKHSEWRSAALKDLKLQQSNLTGLQLSKADFSGSDFTDSNLSNTNLKRARLDLCDCSRVNFENAELNDVQLFKTRLNESDFRSSVLIAANLEQCSGKSVSFIRANLTGAYLMMSVLTESDFTGADLSGANLEGAVLTNSNLALTNLQNSRISETDLTGTNWWRSRGLSLTQKAMLMEKFPATETASEARQRDFQLWKAGFLGDE